jgi:hypothetical protein
MLLQVDDPMATVFNLDDARDHDGKRLTITGADGVAYGRATLRAVSNAAVQLAEREVFAPADRYRIRSGAALEGRAVRLSSTQLRPEQAAFRQRVGDAWGWRCAITGEDVPEVLEAAHLPGANWRTGANEATDGILLRADLHRLLDAGLLRIEDNVVRVVVGSYGVLDGMRIGIAFGHAGRSCAST